MITSQLPRGAKLVFKGEIFEVYQWEQKMFDGSTAIFEKLKRANTAVVIPVVGDKILITIEEQPDKGLFYSIPGGRCEEGEEPMIAAARELLEETGYASSDLVLWREETPASKMIWTLYYYVAKKCEYVQPPALDSGEKIITKLVSFDEFLALADEPLFAEKSLVPILIKARYEPQVRENLHNLLFA